MSPASISTLLSDKVFEALATNADGLTQEEATRRLEQYGPNAIRSVRGTPLYIKFLANFTHLMAILLWAGGAIAFVARMPELGIAVWMVNVINGVFSFWQEYQADRATEALRDLLPVYARVLRDGQDIKVLASELVPGDVVLLAEGDRISADCRLVQAVELRVDQSTLSGESHPVSKTSAPVVRDDLARAELPNLVFAGTWVAAGVGKAVVIRTGMETELGQIAHLTQRMGEELSPLQKEIEVVTKVVTAVAVLVGIAFFLVALFMGVMSLAEGFIFALGMIVAFVPEGLLPTVTLSLAIGVQRMARRNALVKRLSAVETLGSTSVICTDKTGTLTQNEMTVCNVWAANHGYTVTGVGYTPEGQIRTSDGPVDLRGEPDLVRLITAASLCNNARILAPAEDETRWSVLGDPTEAALKVLAAKAGIDVTALAEQMPRIHELPFESRRKRMTTIHQEGSRRVGFVKGAPGEVLNCCTQIRCGNQIETLSAAWHNQIMAANDAYARDGLRVLAVAERTLPDSLDDLTQSAVERDLVFLGLAAMMDPPRPEVVEAVARCRSAQIRVIMITGDYGLTAETIARRIGIVSTSLPRIVTGSELETMDEGALRDLLAQEVIFARVAPEHKLRVVTALQEMGNVVAVTGDGVNDAPALKKADIGVAMGLSGTDVAKEAADMILMDDNFASIVNAAEEGRAIYANIKKFATYIFTSNTPEAVPFILFALSGGRIPLALTIMQILAIDLGTDLVPALALGVEPPEPGVMARPPRQTAEHVISWSMLGRAYLFLGPVQSLAAMAAFYFHYWMSGYWGQWLDLPVGNDLYRAATAMTLAAVVCTQIGNLFAQRTDRASVLSIGFFSNRLVWVGIGSELLLIVMIVYLPFLQRIFGTAAFPASHWLFLFAWIPSLLVADELRKLWVRSREKRRPVEPPPDALSNTGGMS